MKLSLVVALVSMLVMAVPGQARQTFAPDAEGFIRNWLVLAPITFEGDAGGVEIDRPFLQDEAGVRPSPGDKARVGFLQRTWTTHQSPDYFIDFFESYGQNGGEYAAGYALAYVHASQDMAVTLAVGSNDQGKAWLNGKVVFTYRDARGLQRDADLHPVTLMKGQNILMLKVVNEVNSWQACARFLKGDTPVRDITIALAPQ